MNNKPGANEIYSGKKYFFLILGAIGCYLAIWAFVSPPTLVQCIASNPSECFCPIDSQFIAKKNSIIVDTTDPLRAGKYDDVEGLLRDYALRPHSFIGWMLDGKRTDKTSFFILSNQPVPDITPIAHFCRPPPAIALYLSDLPQENVDAAFLAIDGRVKGTMKQVKESASAGSSFIIEMLSTVSSNSSAWSPGGNLILFSDLLENSNQCGRFDSDGVKAIPSFKSISPTCHQLIRRFTANLQPTSVYPKVSLISVCMLPGKPVKPGLIEFWNDLFSEALQGYAATYSCDPAEIADRRRQLNDTTKKGR